MKKKTALNGTVIGIVNVLLGSCGGILAVKTLKSNSLSQKKAHATSIAVILPLTIVSAIIYWYNNNVKFIDATVFLVPGLLGAFTGSIIMPKINDKILRKIFSAFILYAGVRMLFKW